MDRRQRVLGAAIDVLASAGSRGLTHRAVDRAAGLPSGSTSNLFRTRRALIEGVVAELLARDAEQLTALPAGREAPAATSEAEPGEPTGATRPDPENRPTPHRTDREDSPVDLRPDPGDGPADSRVDRRTGSGVGELLAEFVARMTESRRQDTLARYALWTDPDAGALTAGRAQLVEYLIGQARALGLEVRAPAVRLALALVDGVTADVVVFGAELDRPALAAALDSML